MAGAAAQKGPASLDEGLNDVAQAITRAMTAPDATNPQQHQALMSLLKATLGVKRMSAGGGQQGQQGQPPPQGGAPPGGPMQGGGTNIRQIMGGAPSGPSAGMGTPPGMGAGPTADDMRSAVADQAG